MLAVVFTYVAGDVARNMLKNERFREDAYREVAALDDVESLLVQAIDREMLIFITLKSRKFYVGYVTAPTLYTILCKCLLSVVAVQAVTELDNKAAHRHAPVPQRHRPFL